MKLSSNGGNGMSVSYSSIAIVLSNDNLIPHPKQKILRGSITHLQQARLTQCFNSYPICVIRIGSNDETICNKHYIKLNKNTKCTDFTRCYMSTAKCNVASILFTNHAVYVEKLIF